MVLQKMEGGGRRGISWPNIFSHMYLVRIEHLVLLIDKKKPSNEVVAFLSLRPYGACKYVTMYYDPTYLKADLF